MEGTAREVRMTGYDWSNPATASTHSRIYYMQDLLTAGVSSFARAIKQCRECEKMCEGSADQNSIFDYDMCVDCADRSPIVQEMKEEEAKEHLYAKL